MQDKKYKIPKLKNDREAASFWDKHDSTKYLSQTKAVSIRFPKPQHKVVVDIGEKQWKTIQHIAYQKQMSPNRILQNIVLEKLG